MTHSNFLQELFNPDETLKSHDETGKTDQKQHSRRRWMLNGLGGLILISPMSAIASQKKAARSTRKTADPRVAVTRIVKSDNEWRRLLTNQQFEILRRSGTETAFENRYHNHKANGTYACVACGNRLFLSTAKFDSGTGWPSFFKPIDNVAVQERPDNTLFTRRTEVVCSRCGGHLGHVFQDGPRPTGLRYCMNSAALTFFADRLPGPGSR